MALDRADRTYRPGEEITGRVILWMTRALWRCEVRLAIHWRTSGAGDVSRGEPVAIDLVVDERVEAGERLLPFSLPAPDGPPTYAGTLIRVEWVLEAFVRSSEGVANIEEDFVLVDARATVLDGKPRGKVRSRSLVKVPTTPGLGVAAFLGVTALTSVLLGTSLGGGWNCLCSAPGLLFAGIALSMIPGGLAAERLGPLLLEVAEEVAPGEHLRVALRFEPPKRMTLDAIDVTLCAEERATSGAGASRRDETREVARYTVRLTSRLIVDPSGFSGEVELAVPPDAPVSFAAADSSIRWTLRVEIDIPDWPDWRIALPVVVVPGGRAVAPTVRRQLTLQPRQRCPYCRDAIAGAEPAPVASCAGCETVLHEACWEELGRCPTRGCGRERPRVRARP